MTDHPAKDAHTLIDVIAEGLNNKFRNSEFPNAKVFDRWQASDLDAVIPLQMLSFALFSEALGRMHPGWEQLDSNIRVGLADICGETVRKGVSAALLLCDSRGGLEGSEESRDCVFDVAEVISRVYRGLGGKAAPAIN